MRLELERGLEQFLQKIWSKLWLVLFLCFLCYSFTSDTQRTLVSLQVAHPMTQKSLNSIKVWLKYWEVFGNRYVFDDRHSYPSTEVTTFSRPTLIHLTQIIMRWMLMRWMLASPFPKEGAKKSSHPTISLSLSLSGPFPKRRQIQILALPTPCFISLISF
jgi:hypothetical protein